MNDNGLITTALLFETFATVLMSVFVLKPLSNILFPNDSKKMFWKMFIARIVFLLICDFAGFPMIFIFDFLLIFIGAFIIIPILGLVKHKNPFTSTINNEIKKATISNNTSVASNVSVSVNIVKCSKCGRELNSANKFCPSCGTPLPASTSTSQTVLEAKENVPKVIVKPTEFDPIYNLDENQLLISVIKKELSKIDISNSKRMIPIDILKRKILLNSIYSVLVFVYISLIFFHFPNSTYVIGAIILIILFKATRGMDLISYLVKEIKARPGEKISNVVMSTKENLVRNNSIPIFLGTLACGIILPLLIFMEPRILYEKTDGGYGVRFYAFGLNNYETATIPSTYKGKDVVSLRGNTFSNMPNLKEVSLPDTIREIRGQAFKNDSSLVKVNMPKSLEYLGGGAFYGCSSLEEIEIPDSVTHIGGEAFYNATSLKKVKLSKNITEIRGDTFEYCSSLEQIEIPDNVTRIGGHAFYGCSRLNTVTLTENSKLREIGSSAFRQCYSLTEITIPTGVYVNERAFKESPTTIHYFGEEYDTNYNSRYNNNYSYHESYSSSY